MQEISFVFVFMAGLLSFLSPCVLPIVPGYLCFLAGTSLDKIMDEEREKNISVFKYAVAFVLGFSTVFTLRSNDFLVDSQHCELKDNSSELLLFFFHV